MPPPLNSARFSAPALVAGHGRTAMLTEDGELLLLGRSEAATLVRLASPPLLVHAPATWRRLGLPPGTPCLDLLQLFAFGPACPPGGADTARPRARAR